VWERIFADLLGDKKNFYLMLVESTIVHVHQQAAAGRKKGAPKTGLWAFPRRSEQQNPSADGRKCLPVAFRITAGQAAEYRKRVIFPSGAWANGVRCFG
jgi:hypothetical protein